MAIDAVLPQVAPGLVSGLPDPGARATVPSGDDFEARLEAAVRSVSDTQNTADVRLSRLASGEEADLHTTMIALQEADISLRVMVSARDKIVDAYQQVMNMSI